MTNNCISKSTLGRLPVYLRFLQSESSGYENISSAQIARALGLGEVQVRKDLAAVSGKGKPKTGYNAAELTKLLESYLGQKNHCQAVIAGAGKLGRALLDYDGFSAYGIEIPAAFDKVNALCFSDSGKPVYPINELQDFCFRNDIRVGIIAVPEDAAQSVCDMMVRSNISAIYCFSPGTVQAPKSVLIQYENFALSLAHLYKKIQRLYL